MPAGFESILDMSAFSADDTQESKHADSLGGCYDCNFNCEECDST